MKYSKPPLTFEQQTKLLLSRGLIAEYQDLNNFLQQVNYYRFSGYLYPFRQKGSDSFQDGTSLEEVTAIYNFDSALRRFTFSIIEKIDISILRTQLVEQFTTQFGAFCYTQRNNFPKLNKNNHDKVMKNITKSVEKSHEHFVRRFHNKYFGEEYLPFWIISEVVSMSQLSIIFHHCPDSVVVPIAKNFNLHSKNLKNWLHVLTVIRNIVAHHSRLWNLGLQIRPMLPSKKYHPEFYIPYIINNSSYFSVYAIMRYLIKKIDPFNTFHQDFISLLGQYPYIDVTKMGFPTNWEASSLFN
jgi:abortive infection bacteriophage resistance protein